MALSFLIFCLGLCHSQKDLISGQIDGYYSLLEIEQYFLQIETQYPTITQIGSLGDTFQSNSIRYLKLTSQGLPDTQKPALIFSASLFTGYPIGSQAVIHALDKVLQNPSYLSSQICYFIPIINTDAWLQMQSNFYLTGEIQSRFKNLNIDECGTTEGGVNLDRNFDFQWGLDNIGSSADSCHVDYRGISAASQVQTQAVINLASELKPGLWLHYDLFGQIVQHPFTSGNYNSATVLEKEGGVFQEFYQRVSEQIDYKLKTAYERHGKHEHGTIIDYTHELGFFPVYVSLGQEKNEQEDLYDIVSESSELIEFMYNQTAYSVELWNTDIKEKKCEGDQNYTCKEGAFSYFVFQYELQNDSPVVSSPMLLQFELFWPANSTQYYFETGKIFIQTYLDQQDREGLDQDEIYSITEFTWIQQESLIISAQFQISGFETACFYIVVERWNSEEASGLYYYNYTFLSHPLSVSQSDSQFLIEDYQTMQVDQQVRKRGSTEEEDEDNGGGEDRKKAGRVAVIVVLVLVVLVGIGIGIFMYWKRAKRGSGSQAQDLSGFSIEESKHQQDVRV